MAEKILFSNSASLPLLISGVVLKGQREGTALGFPTANLKLKTEISSGIYAGQTKFGEKIHISAIYIPPNGKILETHLLDFIGDLYGQTIEVVIEKKIRESRPFKTKIELLRAIKEDIQMIRNFYREKSG